MTTGGLTRVTIVAPRTRVDLALPSDVPLADLLPTLLRYGGQEPDDPAGRHGWLLSRLGGPAFDADHSPAQLDIRDGEVLYLRPRDAGFPEPVFDDVVDALATASQERADRWLPATTRRFGLTVGLVLLVGGALMVLLAGAPQLPAGIVGVGVAVALVATATMVSRVLGDARTAVLFGVVALTYAGAGGLLLFAGDRPAHRVGAAQVLLAGVAILLASAVTAVGVAAGAAVFLGASVTAAALALAAVVCLVWQATPASAAAVVAVAAFATMPLLPMLSYRLAGLPVPSVPTGAEDLKSDVEVVEGGRVLLLSERADGYLGALLGALAVIGGCAAVALTLTGGLPGILLAAVLGALMLTRARWFVGRRHRLPLLVAGVASLAVVAAGWFAAAGQVLRLSLALPAVLLAAAGTVAYATAGATRRRSPLWGRALDIAEVVLILAVVPLALWAGGAYEWIRTFREG